MFHLNEDFKKKLSPAKWRNIVSSFLNNLCGDGNIEVEKPENPNSGNPPVIKIRWLAFMKTLAKKGVGMTQENTYDNSGTSSQTLANAQALAALAPKPDKYVDDTVATGNTAKNIADNKIALIGTSDRVAREDHRHQLETAQGTAAFRPAQSGTTPVTRTSTMPDDTGGQDFPSGSQFALKTDTWKPNNTDGFTKLEITRIEYDSTNGVHCLFYRQVKYSKNGNPIEVGAELGAVKIDA